MSHDQYMRTPADVTAEYARLALRGQAMRETVDTTTTGATTMPRYEMSISHRMAHLLDARVNADIQEQARAGGLSLFGDPINPPIYDRSDMRSARETRQANQEAAEDAAGVATHVTAYAWLPEYTGTVIRIEAPDGTASNKVIVIEPDVPTNIPAKWGEDAVITRPREYGHMRPRHLVGRVASEMGWHCHNPVSHTSSMDTMP